METKRTCSHARKMCIWFGAHPQYECPDCRVLITYDYTSGEVIDEWIQ